MLDRSREIERNEIRNREHPLYSPSINLDRLRVVEDLSSFKGFDRSIYWTCVQGKRNLDGSRICWGAIEGKKLSWSIHLAVERYRDCDKKQLKSSTDKLGIKRCREFVEVALNQFFNKGKTQIWVQSSMQLNQGSKQHFKLSKIFLNKNVKHIDHTHTHTHTH